MGQCANRNEVHPGFSDLADILQGHVSRGFQLGSSTGKSYCSSHFINRHVVQHDPPDLQFEGNSHILEGASFDLQLDIFMSCTSKVDSLSQTSGEVNVVILDEKHIIKPCAVIPATPQPHRQLFQLPEPGGCLTRIQDDSLRTSHRIHETAGEAGYTRHAAKEIKGSPLGGQQGA